MLTIQDLERQGLIIFKAVSGSKLYGLDTPQSDTDIKGVFVLPKAMYYTWDYVPQVSDERNDEVYYELGRFVELLCKNNPNILEMLNVPPEKILYQHPVFKRLDKDIFLSKKCKDTFAGYAMTQIRKARGLNKKILNPMSRERKGILDFCHVLSGQGSLRLRDWLAREGIRQEDCGLVNVPNMRDVYAIFHDPSAGFGGMVKGPQSLDLRLSSVPKGGTPANHLHFNRDGYSKYCKDYKDYWDWVGKRNDARYQNTLSHGKNYDAKNMMHTFRLLAMAAEILRDGEIRVHRQHDREELLRIRSGAFEYEELIARAQEKVQGIEVLYSSSALPEVPDTAAAKAVLVGMRGEWYGGE